MKYKPEPTLAIIFIALAFYSFYDMVINLVLVGMANFIGPLIGGCCSASGQENAVSGQWKAILLGIIALGLSAYSIGGAIGSFNGAAWLPDVVRNAGVLALLLALLTFVWWGVGTMPLLVLLAAGFVLYKWRNLQPEERNEQI